MVTNREAVDVITQTLRDSSNIPDEMSYLTHEPDTDGEDANVAVPLIEIQDLDTLRDDPSNSTFVEYLTDSDGNRVGYVYEKKWEMTMQLRIWTAAGSDNNVDELGKRLTETLFTYDSRGPAHYFTDSEGQPVKSIYDFSLRESGRDDTLAETPSVRRWNQNARVRGAERLILTPDDPQIEQYTQTVENEEGTIEYVDTEPSP